MDLTEAINKHKNRIFNLIVIILALAIANNIYRKQSREIELLNAKKDAGIKKSSVLESISQLNNRINSYKNLLTKKDANLVINTTSDIAKASGVKILSVKPAMEQRFADYTKFPFDLMVSAPNYHALGKFISGLESYEDIYFIEALNINFEKTTKELNITLKISSTIFTD